MPKNFQHLATNRGHRTCCENPHSRSVRRLALHNGVLQRALLRPVLVCVPGGLRAAGDFFLPDRAPPRPPPMPLQPRIAHSGGGRLGGGGGKERRGAEEPVSPPAYFPY